MSNTLESLKITNDRPSFFTKKFWNTFIDKLAALVRPYDVYVALLSQSGTDAPVAQIFENTVGDIIWHYNSVGTYYGVLGNTFTESNTIVYPRSSTSIINDADITFFVDEANGPSYVPAAPLNIISIFTGLPSNSTASNGVLYTPIEIRVYR